MTKNALVLCAGAFGLLALSPSPKLAVVEDAWTRQGPVGITALPLVQDASCVICDRCTGYSHIAIAHEDGLRSGSPHACGTQEGSCTDHRVDCKASQDDAPEIQLSAVWNTLTRGSVEEVRDLLRGHPTRIVFNRDRGALQVVGCDETLAANIPLGTGFATRLAQSLAE